MQATPKHRTLCNRLALVHVSGDVLYPVAIRSRGGAAPAWLVSPGGKDGNLRAVAREIKDEKELIRAVTVDGMSVRACTQNGRRHGLYSPTGRSVVRVMVNG